MIINQENFEAGIDFSKVVNYRLYKCNKTISGDEQFCLEFNTSTHTYVIQNTKFNILKELIQDILINYNSSCKIYTLKPEHKLT